MSPEQRMIENAAQKSREEVADRLQRQKIRIAELEAERDRQAERNAELRAENALLLKALEAVRPSCRAAGCWCPEYLGYADDRRHSDACIVAKAALARIPEPKP